MLTIEKLKRTRPKRSAAQMLPECRWEGCDREDSTHGFCKTHYARVRYNKDLEYLLPEHARCKRCWVPECDRPAQAHELCRTHYRFIARHTIGDIEHINAGLVAKKREEKRAQFAVPINGDRLALVKLVYGATLADIARVIGRSGEYIRQVISGKIHTIGKEDAQALASHYRVPVEWLCSPDPFTIDELLPTTTEPS